MQIGDSNCNFVRGRLGTRFGGDVPPLRPRSFTTSSCKNQIDVKSTIHSCSGKWRGRENFQFAWLFVLNIYRPSAEPDGGLTNINTFPTHRLAPSSFSEHSKAMSTQLDIVYKLKEALETGNPEVAIPFMADDFTHQALPTQYVS